MYWRLFKYRSDNPAISRLAFLAVVFLIPFLNPNVSNADDGWSVIIRHGLVSKEQGPNFLSVTDSGKVHIQRALEAWKDKNGINTPCAEGNARGVEIVYLGKGLEQKTDFKRFKQTADAISNWFQGKGRTENAQGCQNPVTPVVAGIAVNEEGINKDSINNTWGKVLSNDQHLRFIVISAEYLRTMMEVPGITLVRGMHYKAGELLQQDPTLMTKLIARHACYNLLHESELTGKGAVSDFFYNFMASIHYESTGPSGTGVIKSSRLLSINAKPPYKKCTIRTDN